MIKKAKKLKNVGKFYDFSAQENALDWRKNTFVFAPNAYGKSTLVNVLSSLRDNDPKLIRARKTLGTSASPEAIIVSVRALTSRSVILEKNTAIKKAAPFGPPPVELRPALKKVGVQLRFTP